MDKRVHDMYLGALIVMRDGTNPDRIAMAGHALRELCVELMRGAGIEKTKYNLGSEVNNLKQPWDKVQNEAKACSGLCGNCAGKNLRKFLQLLSGFFARHSMNRPKATEKIASAIGQIDVNRRIAGSNEHMPAAQRWEEIHDFFNKCGHHGPTTFDELQSRLFEFEELLIRLLLPTPSGDMTEIDEILAEEKANA